MGESHDEEERWEAGEEKAEGIVREELLRRGWDDTGWERRRQADDQRVRMTASFRRETIVTSKWIVRRLHMGRWTHVSKCLAKANSLSVNSED